MSQVTTSQPATRSQKMRRSLSGSINLKIPTNFFWTEVKAANSNSNRLNSKLPHCQANVRGSRNLINASSPKKNQVTASFYADNTKNNLLKLFANGIGRTILHSIYCTVQCPGSRNTNCIIGQLHPSNSFFLCHASFYAWQRPPKFIFPGFFLLRHVLWRKT